MAQFIAFLANPFPMQNNFLIGVKYVLKIQCMCFLNKTMSVGNHEVACMKSVIYNELSQKKQVSICTNRCIVPIFNIQRENIVFKKSL